MNSYERKVFGNYKWWHRNISRQGFQINGYVHAYPDIIAMTHSDKILVIEPKGDFLENESKQKANAGMKWSSLAGKNSAILWCLSQDSQIIPEPTPLIVLWKL